MQDYQFPPQAKIAYAHLQVSDLEESLKFYQGILGLHIVSESEEAIYLSPTGQTPYLIALTERKGATTQQHFATGLYHIAIRYPDRPALANAVLKLLQIGWPLQGASDHGVSEAIYLPDPDGLGIELYRDRPQIEWPKQGDQIAMISAPLDINDLLTEVSQHNGAYNIHPDTDLGHIHLKVSNLANTERFYNQLLGLDVTQRDYPGALFLSAGGYHHHVGANTWNSENAKPPADDAVGLLSYAFALPDEISWRAAIKRLQTNQIELEDFQVTDLGSTVILRDFDHIAIEITLPGKKIGLETLQRLET